jgi:hypothetical protein
VLQALGVESIVLGFVSYMAELWARHEWRADKEVPLRILVGLADLTRTLTDASPLIALTVLGILLIVVGAALRRLDSNAQEVTQEIPWPKSGTHPGDKRPACRRVYELLPASAQDCVAQEPRAEQQRGGYECKPLTTGRRKDATYSRGSR